MVDSNDKQDDYTSLDLARAIELLEQKDGELSLLIHRLKQLEKMVYGPRSAKRSGPLDFSTLLPFSGMQELLESATKRAEDREAKRKEEEARKSKDTKKANRGKPRSFDLDIPKDTPRHRRVKKLEGDQCQCSCGGKLKEIREEVSRRLDQVKLVYVDERVTTHYSCRDCEKMVSVAPEQETVVEGGSLGPGLLANFVFQRFANHTPYHRLEREYKQMGIPISRTVIGRNVLKCGELLQPIYDRIKQQVVGSFLVQFDDTPVVVRNGKKKGRKTGRIWIYRSQDGNVIFDFRMDRSQEGPRDIVGDFKGFLQSDAYVGHDFLFKHNSVRIELGCWAHVARKFRDARDSDGDLVAEFDVLFALLTQIENDVRPMPPPERFLYRMKHARPVLQEIETWMHARFLTVLPKSPIGNAISYAQNQWQALNNYLLDGRITDITNNAAERALRRVAIGRKNWMNIGIEDAGPPAAVLMSILQTCAEHDVNAIDYLRDVLVRVNQTGSAAEIEDLTPQGWKRSQAAKDRVAANRRTIAEALQSLTIPAPA